MEIEIILACLILIALVFLAAIDLAFAQLSDLGLRRLLSDTEEMPNARGVEFLKEILEDRSQFRFVLSSTIQFLLIAFTVIVTVIVNEMTSDPTQMLLWALLIALVATVLFRQILPRLFVRNNPESKLLFLLPVVRPIYALAAAGPFLKKAKTKKELQKLDSTATPELSDDDDGDDDFLALMDVGEAEGILEVTERELIESMVEFSDTRAGEIMTPRTEICAVPVDSSIRSARDLIVEEKYSRLPVYRDSIDNIEGVIYVRDLLSAWANGNENDPISGIIRPAYFVPETKSAAELLKNMQTEHVQLAIVIDEYGGLAGIVTVEDIVEEIVGEIEDEDIEDEEIIEIIEGEDGYFDVLGSTEIDKIERLFDIEIEDEDFTTIAGLITSEAGYVPKTGEELTIRGLEVRILRADAKRIALLRLRKADEITEGEQPS